MTVVIKNLYPQGLREEEVEVGESLHRNQSRSSLEKKLQLPRYKQLQGHPHYLLLEPVWRDGWSSFITTDQGPVWGNGWSPFVRAGAGVWSEIGSSTSGSSLTGRAPAINLLLEECNRLLASEVMKRQHCHTCFTRGMYSACYIIKTTRKAKCNIHAVLDCA